MQDTNDIQNQAPSQPIPPPQQNQGMSEDEKRAESYKVRLSKARQEAEEEAKRADQLAKELAALKKKFETGKATTNESADYVTTENKIAEAEKKGIDPDALPGIIEQHLQQQKFEQKMEEAQNKDPQLKALMNDPSSIQKISKAEFDSLSYLDNAPAVFKHLLTNDSDRMVLKAAEQDYAEGRGTTAYYQVLSNLSQKLKSSAQYPHPPSYKEITDLSDVGEGGSWDISDYIKQKARVK